MNTGLPSDRRVLPAARETRQSRAEIQAAGSGSRNGLWMRRGVLERLRSAVALVAVLIAGVSVAQAQGPRRLSVVLLGDSYSAGTGADGDRAAPLGCFRRPTNWASQYMRLLDPNWPNGAVELINRACHGAQTTHVLGARYGGENQIALTELRFAIVSNPLTAVQELESRGVCTAPDIEGEGVQTWAVRLGGVVGTNGAWSASYRCEYEMRSQLEAVTPDTDLVLLTIGGNDFPWPDNAPPPGADEATGAFASVIYGCYVPVLKSRLACESAIQRGRARIEHLLAPHGAAARAGPAPRALSLPGGRGPAPRRCMIRPLRQALPTDNKSERPWPSMPAGSRSSR